jgi:hypothetical protein
MTKEPLKMAGLRYLGLIRRCVPHQVKVSVQPFPKSHCFDLGLLSLPFLRVEIELGIVFFVEHTELVPRALQVRTQRQAAPDAFPVREDRIVQHRPIAVGRLILALV